MKKFKHQQVDWDSNHPRIVLYADIMGFKAKLNNTAHENVILELRGFVVAVSKHLSPYQTGGHLRMTLFSDLIVIAADRADKMNFRLIVNAAAALLHECHIFGFPINGCITCGELAFDEAESFTINNGNLISNSTLNNGRKGQYMPLFVGNSVVKAYLLNEDMFFYGVVLHPSAEQLLEEYNQNSDILGILPFYKLPVPLKSGGKAFLHYLDWPQIKLAKNKVSQENIIEYLNTLEKSVGVRPRAYIYNTRKIIESIESSKSGDTVHSLDATINNQLS